MCGIAGFIGESKNQNLTYEIITSVFSQIEVRGIDAAGFWGANKNGNTIYHKEPLRSSLMVSTETWKRVKKFNPNLFLVHTRDASVGDPTHNKNNHPFTNIDRSLCLTHNGKIPEFGVLKTKFEVFSNCDSEILLRIIEATEYTNEELIGEFPNLDQCVSKRLFGIRDVFSLIHNGHMAVSLGEIVNDVRNLYLFRNNHRPLWVVDLRETLGQVFYCSTPSVWQDALTGYNLNKQILIEIPPEEVWHFSTDVKIQRLKVHKEKELKVWDSKKDKLITNLDDGRTSNYLVNNIKQRCLNLVGWIFATYKKMI